ncbi:diguanylate cyclase/phosphodiesterase (GGDEF & EAL domains) with PAS/PAC sensor(s) [uncultured Coleofasciculus sp.]|uniref:histidine kinase n=1 Tax=uncultured Coleofasciculus sp. TaxID=1267456 RepID=A0A6J4IKF2_9CYAN|nr:diguanylate cyclase/phosphodiesterase (GGDEF & EAL domains) with PAS/PAC sensor(s) [uncultured Coleofasciculus sp.]
MAEISQTNFKRRLTLALTLPLLLMSLLAAILFGQINHLTSSMQWVNHTDQVISQANHTEKLLVDLETGLRGYLVTGNLEFLEPYKEASSVIASTFDEFARLISDNPKQIKRLGEVRSLHQQWYRYAQQLIAVRQQEGDYQSYAINIQGKKLMDQIRGEMASFIQTEEVLRNTRTRTVQKTTQWLLISGIPLFLGIGAFLAFFIWRQLMAVARSYARALKVAQEHTEALLESEAALRRFAQRLATLHQIDRSILAAQASATLIYDALTQMRQLLPYQQAFVVLFNFETNTAIVMAGSVNGDLSMPETPRIPLADFELDGVLQPTICYVEDLSTSKSPPALQRLLDEEARCYLTVPLVVEDNLMGKLYLVANQKAAFAAEHQIIATEVADQLAIALQQTNLREQLQNYTAQLEQRVAERTAELQETNEELEAFSYSVSHDLRAPLRTLQGFTQALMEDYGSQLDDLGQDYARYIVEAAVSMDTLIADLLAYSRLGRTEIQIQPTDLSRVLAEALSQLDTERRERNAQIILEAPLPQVMAQYRILVQVLTNLLSNAIKFVKPDVQPQVRVWAEEREKSVRFWVEDNGLGIAEEHQERIFRVFERLHGIEAYPGTGIGLAIVRKGIEHMGGRVGVVSQPDKGSRFWLEFPKSGVG